MIVPLCKLPSGLATFAKLFPAAGAVDGIARHLGTGRSVPTESWGVLAVWAVAAPSPAVLRSLGMRACRRG